MKFSSVVLFAGLSSAACVQRPTLTGTSSTNPNATAPDPSTYENVDISDLYVHQAVDRATAQVTGVDAVEFTINGNVTCSAQNPGNIGKVFGCGSTAYSFGLLNGTTTQFGLSIYKSTSAFAGWYGTGDVPTYCHAGGGDTSICSQVNPTTIVITGQNGISK